VWSTSCGQGITLVLGLMGVVPRDDEAGSGFDMVACLMPVMRWVVHGPEYYFRPSL
jgi:hypothetical protein